MRAIEVRRFGPPEVLQIADLPDPVPGPGQVLVAASASDVLFLDTMIRSGAGQGYFPVRPPYVPGNGVGGMVLAVGESVSPRWLGQRVVAHTAGAGGANGYAEFAVAHAEHSAVVPDDVDLRAATAVLHDGTTALGILEAGGIRPGEWVLGRHQVTRQRRTARGAAARTGLLDVGAECDPGHAGRPPLERGPLTGDPPLRFSHFPERNQRCPDPYSLVPWGSLTGHVAPTAGGRP